MKQERREIADCMMCPYRDGEYFICTKYDREYSSINKPDWCKLVAVIDETED